jgi:hypothetical protein
VVTIRVLDQSGNDVVDPGDFQLAPGGSTGRIVVVNDFLRCQFEHKGSKKLVRGILVLAVDATNEVLTSLAAE